MSTTSGRPIVRPTLQTVPESLPADHVTQPAQAAVATSTPSPAVGTTTEKSHQAPVTSTAAAPAVSLKPRSTSSRVSCRCWLLKRSVWDGQPQGRPKSSAETVFAAVTLESFWTALMRGPELCGDCLSVASLVVIHCESVRYICERWVLIMKGF